MVRGRLQKGLCLSRPLTIGCRLASATTRSPKPSPRVRGEGLASIAVAVCLRKRSVRQRAGDRGFRLQEQPLLVALHEQPERQSTEDHEGQQREADGADDVLD
ncbi:hypothetical protein MetexDRAFT_2586 [Methylorubrum extorquens DSM 13060]|uniref:Uncharacterized protein n=1 Tax=Methylorubrum extorquens DSM 13060 TaxID=882800 RepID=H1KIX4_METEX|nr:hypothetical protein MetexDRAFT_2586 [Methylorubrum extorquens DSM 13060]BDL42033.1 hypothetical protein MSPGM_46230 [Methylorubrum sp. GM97]